ncbi:MAG: hypothetical protein FWG44_07705 [Oscillospiraceae bacterium]|nr:hypothetical protein [Oscillospiraceae bacterium]
MAFLKTKRAVLYTVSLLFLTASLLLFLIIRNEQLYLTAFLLFISSAGLFIFPALFALKDTDLRKKYVTAYGVFGTMFILGLATIIISIVSLSLFIGATAHLIAESIKSFKTRVIFHISSLSASFLLLLGTIIYYIYVQGLAESAPPEDIFARFNPSWGEINAVLYIILASVVFLGFLCAFIIRYIIWRRTKRHDDELLGKSKPKVYKSGTLQGTMRRPDEVRKEDPVKKPPTDSKIFCIVIYLLSAGLFIFGMNFEKNNSGQIPFAGQWNSFRGFFISFVGLVIFFRITYSVFKNKK